MSKQRRGLMGLLHNSGKKYCSSKFLDPEVSCRLKTIKGPRIEPWGTPKVIVALLEEMFPTDTALR